MAKSIIQSNKSCFITGQLTGLHKHHIFNGPLRNFSESEGLWVYLSSKVHRDLHDSSKLAYELKRVGQYYFEEKYSHDEFMKRVRKNYLVEPLTDEEKNKYKIGFEPYDIEEFDFLSLKKETVMENKNEYFKRIAEKRVNSCIKGIRQIKSMSNRNYYEYTKEDVDKIVDAIKVELCDLEKSYNENKEKRFHL